VPFWPAVESDRGNSKNITRKNCVSLHTQIEKLGFTWRVRCVVCVSQGLRLYSSWVTSKREERGKGKEDKEA
jgi:hypothetical protein